MAWRDVTVRRISLLNASRKGIRPSAVAADPGMSATSLMIGRRVVAIRGAVGAWDMFFGVIESPRKLNQILLLLGNRLGNESSYWLFSFGFVG